MLFSTAGRLRHRPELFINLSTLPNRLIRKVEFQKETKSIGHFESPFLNKTAYNRMDDVIKGKGRLS